MKKHWLELSVTIPAALTELAADELCAAGCLGVNVEERELDTFVLPDPDADIPEVYRVRLYYPPEDDVEALRQQVRALLASLPALVPGWEPELPAVHTVAQQDWAEGWKQHFSATRFGKRLVVRPTWEDGEDAAGDIIVRLDPGMAFGTGSHETTRLCLQALADLYDSAPRPRLLDVGTGSGILAIAAVKLGATTVIANDIDPEACTVARENAALNGVADRVAICETPLEEIGGAFDVVIANILAEENVRLAEHLCARVAPGGSLLLSGILREKEALVRDGFVVCGLTGPEVTYDADWCCLHYRRPA